MHSKVSTTSPLSLVLITAVGVAACSHNSGGLLCAEPVLIASLSCSCSSCARRRCPSFSSPPHLSAGAGHAHAASVTATSSTHVYSHDDAPLTLLVAPYMAIPCPLPAHSTAGLTPGSRACLTQHKRYEMAGISARQPNQRSRSWRDVVSTPRGVTLPSHASA